MNIIRAIFAPDQELTRENNALRVDVQRQREAIERLCDQVEALEEINEYLERRLREEKYFDALKTRLALERSYKNREGESGAWVRGRIELLEEMIAQAEEKR